MLSSLNVCEIDSLAEPTTNSTATSSVVGEPMRPPRSKSARSSRSLMIFDWDDTILPTSYLAKLGYKLDSPDPTPAIQLVLDEYSLLVNQTLTEAARRGHVMIVTNAETGWIQLTVEKFLPKSVATVGRFEHISARSMFEPTGVLTPIGWKENAFKMVVQEYLRATGRTASSSSGKCQVISLGDSGHEREAILKVCDEFRDEVICKSLKFMERPDIDSLKKEHLLIQECLADILTHKDHLDLCIQASTFSSLNPQ